VQGARRFDYTFEWGGGVRVHTSATRALQVGYGFHPLSNLYAALVDPGVDAHLFHDGVEWPSIVLVQARSHYRAGPSAGTQVIVAPSHSRHRGSPAAARRAASSPYG
jgi:hypothetical protein